MVMWLLIIEDGMRRETKSRGIIIRKHFPQRLRISLIDEQYGHLSVIPASWQWASYASTASIISYELVEERESYFIKAAELLTVPSYDDELIILFVHHLLEICYFCLPIQGGKTECFELLWNVIHSLDHFSLYVGLQKLLLAKLLFVIGLYPTDVDQLSISAFLHLPYDQLIELALTHDHKKELEIFIYQCIKFHPYGRLLKTVNFLSRVR